LKTLILVISLTFLLTLFSSTPPLPTLSIEEEEETLWSRDLDLEQALLQALERRQLHISTCDRLLVCRLHKPCGFSCGVHHLVHCLANALAMNRTLVLDDSGWLYKARWEEMFLPISPCRLSFLALLKQRSFPDPPSLSSSKQILSLPFVDFLETEFEPPAMPPDVQRRVQEQPDMPELKRRHPELIWVGIMARFLLRPHPRLRARLMERKAREHDLCQPYFGVHVRRTDKLHQEMALHPLSEYMDHVEALADHPGKRCVYLSTDEPNVLEEARASYPHFRFVTQEGAARLAKQDRYSLLSLEGIFTDIYFLSQTRHIVCTLSSYTCRLALELAPAKTKITSLDTQWYFGGQITRWECIKPQQEEEASAHDLLPDDRLRWIRAVRREKKQVYVPRLKKAVTIPATVGWLCPPKDPVFPPLLPENLSGNGY